MSKLIEYAKQKESEGQLIDAYNYYEMAMEEKGVPFDIRKDMGNVLNKMGRYDEALNCFDLVLTMDEKHIESLFGKGISYLGLGKWIDAYNSFGKVISNLDNQHANCWYYMAIIANFLKNEGGYEDNFRKKDINYFFDKFKEFDNETFLEIRSNFKFGLYFDYYKNDLFGSKKRLNISGFKDELRLSGASPEEIDLYLKTLPYDVLIVKIKTLKEIQHENNIKQIIINILRNDGFSDDEINGVFEIESIEVLQQEALSLNNEIKFPELDTSVNVPLYIKSRFGRFIDENSTPEYDMIKSGISQFNRFTTVLDPMDKFEFIYNVLKINPRNINKKVFYSRKTSKKKSNDYYNRFANEVNSKVPNINYSNLKKAYRFCPKDYYNLININFCSATFLSKFGSIDEKLNSYNMFYELIDYIDYLKNKDIILFNYANVAYDLCLWYPELIESSLSLYEEYLKLNPDDEDVIYLIKSLEVYKSKIQK